MTDVRFSLINEPHTRSCQSPTAPRSIRDKETQKRSRSSSLLSPQSGLSECDKSRKSATSSGTSSPKQRTRKRSRIEEMVMSAPSYVKAFDEALPFEPGEYLGIFAFLPESSVSFRVSAYSLLHQSSGPKIFAFYGQGNDRHIYALSELAGYLREEFDASVYAVSGTQAEDENPYDFPIIFDPKSNLIRYCRASDPNAGGKHAMSVIIIVDSFGKRRTFLPVGYGGYLRRPVPIENLDWVLKDALEYMRYEQQQRMTS
ncbi:hypothetical protein V1512DRAFT_264641 [Lipomyces arxii]|uniref:uncharacterized protein n=1 Tax=Lipomyces arxii TaxID=56418 RepID=UPI0034CDBC6A